LIPADYPLLPVSR